MEILKDIFVTCDIAVQLKGIGFDEPCIGYYEKDETYVRLNDKTQGTIKHNGLLIYISAPTWEQVKKWFRDKGYFSTIKINLYGFYYGSIGMHETIDLAQEDIYEEARETLILKLIEIYKNGK